MGKRVVAAMFQFVSGLTSMQCTLFCLGLNVLLRPRNGVHFYAVFVVYSAI